MIQPPDTYTSDSVIKPIGPIANLIARMDSTQGALLMIALSIEESNRRPDQRKLVQMAETLVDENEREWKDLWTPMEEDYHKGGDRWFKTSDKMYWEMLECLPPARMEGNKFAVGEPWEHNRKGQPVYATFQKTAFGVIARYMALEDW